MACLHLTWSISTSGFLSFRDLLISGMMHGSAFFSHVLTIVIWWHFSCLMQDFKNEGKKSSLWRVILCSPFHRKELSLSENCPVFEIATALKFFQPGTKKIQKDLPWKLCWLWEWKWNGIIFHLRIPIKICLIPGKFVGKWSYFLSSILKRYKRSNFWLLGVEILTCARW